VEFADDNSDFSHPQPVARSQRLAGQPRYSDATKIRMHIDRQIGRAKGCAWSEDNGYDIADNI